MSKIPNPQFETQNFCSKVKLITETCLITSLGSFPKTLENSLERYRPYTYFTSMLNIVESTAGPEATWGGSVSCPRPFPGPHAWYFYDDDTLMCNHIKFYG